MLDMQNIINQFKHHGIDEARILSQIAKLHPIHREVNICKFSISKFLTLSSMKKELQRFKDMLK
jgi:hypothetical protein